MFVYVSCDITYKNIKDTLTNKLPKYFIRLLIWNPQWIGTFIQNLFLISTLFSVHNSVLFCHKRGEMGWILSWHSACEVSRRSQLLFLGLGKRFGDKTATLKSTTQFLQTRQTTLTPNSRSSSRKEMRWERETDLCTYLQLKVVKEATWLKHTHSNDVFVCFANLQTAIVNTNKIFNHLDFLRGPDTTLRIEERG